MSGPKTSRYTLTPEQRRILAERRKLERRKAVISENIRQSSKRLLQIGSMFDAEKKIASELAGGRGDDHGSAKLFAKLDALISPIQPLVAKIDFDVIASAEATEKQIKESLSKAEKLAQKIAAAASKNERELKTALNTAIDSGFGSSFADVSISRQSKVPQAVIDAKQGLRTAQLNAVLPKALIVELGDAARKLDEITDASFAKNFVAISVNPLLQRAKQYSDEYAMCHEEFEALYAEYTALCELYRYEAREYPCSAESVEKLKEEISRINDEVAEDDEQSYISECIDEAMSDMGYSVIGNREVTKKSGKHFRNELFTYGEGTAVNVTYSSDGRIAMELGGLDTCDRAPSTSETEALCASMESFCTDFREIEKRLMAKGVVAAERISILPPKAEYAQIINTSDYSITAETDKLHVKKQRRKTNKQSERKEQG